MDGFRGRDRWWQAGELDSEELPSAVVSGAACWVLVVGKRLTCVTRCPHPTGAYR